MAERITLEEPRVGGYPVVKRTALGQVFNGAILETKARDRQKPNPATGVMEVIIKPSNGKPAQEMVVTCMTLPGTTAPAGLGEEMNVPEPGEIVRLILKGKAFGDYIEAKKGLPDSTVAVGDIISQTTQLAQVYDQNGQPTGGEITDQAAIDQARQRGRSVGIYGPLVVRAPKDGSEWLDKAVEKYHELQRAQRPVADAPPQGQPQAQQQAPADDPWGSGPSSAPAESYIPDDEPPF